MSLDEKEKYPIKVVLIIEVLGRPKENVISTLEEISKEMEKEKGLKLIEKKIHEAKEIEKQKGMFTSYAEIEIAVEDILTLALISFRYMPANIEIIEPENINLTNIALSDIMTEIIGKLHQYDEVVRVVQMEKQILENQVKKLAGEKMANLFNSKNQNVKVKEEKSQNKKLSVKKEDKKK